MIACILWGAAVVCVIVSIGRSQDHFDEDEKDLMMKHLDDVNPRKK